MWIVLTPEMLEQKMNMALRELEREHEEPWIGIDPDDGSELEPVETELYPKSNDMVQV